MEELEDRIEERKGFAKVSNEQKKEAKDTFLLEYNLSLIHI